MDDLNKKAKYDITAIGSALLDFTVEVDDSVQKFGLEKGGMQLIDEERSGEILQEMKHHKFEVSPGGSAANTVAVLNCGGSGVFQGKVGADKNGDKYNDETEKSGVRAHLGRHNSMTGDAITFITPDYERTFATHLGAAQQFNKGDINADDISHSRIIHIEGYLFEPPGLREACMHAISIAKKHNVKVSIDLSDPGLISRIHDVFKEVVSLHADIVFVNEDEARSFTGKEHHMALDELHEICDFVVVKLGARGSLIKTKGTSYVINPFKAQVVNTNGAGDMYAGGVLYGLSHGLTPDQSGKLGSYASSLVISQVGARIKGKIDLSAITLI